MTVAEVFEQMGTRFKPEKAGDLSVVIQFDLSGDDGGQWHINIANQAYVLDKGVAESPKATIKMAAADFVAMTTGKLNPMAAFMSGKIKVEGDLNTVMKFQSIFGM